MANGAVKWALLSVFSKEGIVDFARRLVTLGWKIVSSGNTAKRIREAGIEATDVADLVGGGAILGHRVVTLSREVHAGLLANLNKPDDLAELEKLGIPVIDLVCCDFYPLANAIVEPDATIDSVVEMTDIGGPTMVRSAAKGGRIVVCRPEDREWVLRELETTGDISAEHRQALRARAEFEVTKYTGHSAVFHGAGGFSVITGERVGGRSKGENGPQCPAALYVAGTGDPLALDKFQLVEGSALSYNNLCDVDRLLQTLSHIAAARKLNFMTVPSIAVGVKHGNPCGAAVGREDGDVARSMVSGDKRAIFGGFVMTNFRVSGEIAESMAATLGGKALFDGVVAPSFDDRAVEVLSRKQGKCRLVQNSALLGVGSAAMDVTPRFRCVRGGHLCQPNYTFVLDLNDPGMKMYGTRNPTGETDLLLAWGVGCTSNSNTITIVKDGTLIGNGVGQQDRVGAAELAIKRAIDAGHADELDGAVAYSDSFFPFPDAVQVLIDSGIKAIFSTSGSVNDHASQELCMKGGVTLYQLPDAKARGFFGH